MGFAETDLDRNGFLDGRVQCLQPRAGFRAGADTVFLAAAVRARPGELVLELGCGAGVALCCLGARVAGLDLTGLEVQPDYAALASRNLADNGLQGHILTGDVTSPPAALSNLGFDHVFFNPPYFPDPATPAPDVGRDTARRGSRPLLDAFADLALRRLKPGGILTAILATPLLPPLLASLEGRAGGFEILPLAARTGRQASRVILWARKGGSAPLVMHFPLVIHDGERHVRDGDDHSAAARQILRDGAALSPHG